MEFLRQVARALSGAAKGPRIGKYRIIRRLAEGGMGEIFLAVVEGRQRFEKVVVLKRILQPNMADRDAVRMFLDEARLMATLNHPNIVQVYDFGTAAGAHFFTMEYLHGEDLGRIMKAGATLGRPLSLELAIGAIVDAAAGLHYAHEKRGRDGEPLQIVHRDISPSNVLVSYEGAVKLTDFGIAKWSKRETETRYGALKGKIAYMSPEQCRGEDLDRRSDVFGLGILLYELTTGTRLFQGTSDYGILEQIVNHDVPPPSSRRVDYPPAVERIVLKALARERDHRHQSARELQLELEEYALEARLQISAVARASEMEALFGRKIGAWREAAQAGRSLGDHLASMPSDAPFAPTLQILDVGADAAAPARTGTLPEGGLPFARTGAARSAAAAPPSHARRRVALGAAAAGLLGAGAWWTLGRAQPARLPAPPIAAPAPSPRPTITAEREAPSPDRRAGWQSSPAGPPSAPAHATQRHARKKTPEPARKGAAPQPATAATPGKKNWDRDSIFLPP